MAAMINLEDMPQLVLQKITSFLRLKELLTLELVSRKMKCAVDVHFSTTDNLIIGYLPKLNHSVSWRCDSYGEATDNNKKCLDGLLNIIKRCGIMLRTIHISFIYRSNYPTVWNYKFYFSYLFSSSEMSENCPNVEKIIAFPKMDSYTILANTMFCEQNIMLDGTATEIYAENIKSKGKTCKLRSITYSEQYIPGLDFYKRILSLYTNLEQMTVKHDKTFVKFLPQFIKNGLKDLNVLGVHKMKHVKTYCDIGKNLRTLRLTGYDVTFQNDDDIKVLKKLQVPKNLELSIRIEYGNDDVAQLSENVYNSIITCYVDGVGVADYSLLKKLKNVIEFNIDNLALLKAVAEGQFPKLARIMNGNWLCSCHEILPDPCDLHRGWFCSCQILPNTCDLQTFLPQLLMTKGNSLIFIDIITVCRNSVDVVWKALKHCTAAKFIRFGQFFVDSELSVTHDDVKAICLLPNLHELKFGTIVKDESCDPFRELMEIAVKEHSEFQLKHDIPKQKYTLNRIHF